MRCLVTGGSRNLGRALCVAFARAGAKVAFTYLKRDEDAKATRRQLTAEGASPLVFRGSVADANHARHVVASVLREWGGLDVLVNNAGPTQVVPIALLEEEDWDAMVNAHLKGAYLFSREALKPMIRARSGHILNIGSITGERMVEAPVHYAAAKAGLQGLTRALAREMGRYGIRVNCLAPGLLAEGFSGRLPGYRREEYLSHCPLGRLASLEETAAFAVWLVSAENTFMTGARLAFDGGL